MNYFSDTAFDLPNPKPMTKIVKKCLLHTNNDISSLIWQVLNPKTKEYELELPKCVHLCQNKLPFDDEFHNMTWREGYKGVGEKANYKCLGNYWNTSKIFNSNFKCLKDTWFLDLSKMSGRANFFLKSKILLKSNIV